MPAPLFDSHCHLDDDQFDTDRHAVLARAKKAGVGDIVLPATMQSRWRKTLDVAAQHTRTHAALGLHPLYLTDDCESDVIELERLLQSHNPVAIGECGLDGSTQAVPTLQQQQACLEAQLQLARRTDLPVILHARGAVEAVYLAVRAARVQRGVVHSFNGSEQQAHRLIDQGMMLGFGGAITYPRAHRLRKLVSRLPLDALMIETDAPFQSGYSHAGTRNEPAWLVEVVATFSELRKESSDEIAAATHNNACRLFGLDDEATHSIEGR